MDGLPIELITSIGFLLSYDELSAFSRTAKKYHTVLTRPLYDRVYKYELPAIQEQYTHADGCKGYSCPSSEAWYDMWCGKWFHASKRWESGPVIEAFAACPLDQINSPDDQGITLLHYYAALGNMKLVDVFLRKGMHVDSTASRLSLTPLHCAVTTDGTLDTIEYLLSKGADLEARDAGGRTPLFFALKSSVFIDISAGVRSKVSSTMDRNDKPTGEDSDDEETRPAVSKRLDIVKFLIDRGADTSALNSTGRSPLMYAAGYSNSELCQVMITAALRKKDNISARSKKAGLNAGATVDRAASNNESLHQFISVGGNHDLSQNNACYEVLRQLISSTSNINAQDFAGNTAVHFAAWAGDCKMALIVLEAMRTRGVEPLTNNRGFTPLHTAAERPKSVEVLQTLVESGIAINSKSNTGETALHVAARKCNAQAVEYLIALGADFTLEDYEGHTPLHRATIQKCVAPLIDAGCVRHVDCEWCPGSWWDNFLESQREFVGPSE